MSSKFISWLALIFSIVALSATSFSLINSNQISTETATPPLTQIQIDYSNPGTCTTATPAGKDKNGKTTYSYESHRANSKAACYQTKNWSDWDGDGPGGEAHNFNNPGHDDSHRGSGK